MKPETFNRSIQFFWDNASYSHIPAIQTREEGHLESAIALAQAELEGCSRGFSFVWAIDPDITSADFSDELPPYEQYQCSCLNYRGQCLASLGGIDFGRDNQPWDQDYRRVVEAELAIEATC